jgi:hypothetical protein
MRRSKERASNERAPTVCGNDIYHLPAGLTGILKDFEEIFAGF